MSKNILGIFDSGDMQSIATLIEKLEESSFDYLKLEGDGVKIVIGKNGAMVK
jgi:acetyl-CoA carboxylase biotin carboxyl carrier protein